MLQALLRVFGLAKEKEPELPIIKPIVKEAPEQPRSVAEKPTVKPTIKVAKPGRPKTVKKSSNTKSKPKSSKK